MSSDDLGSGGVCCLKKASVVAALVSDRRRDAGAGGDSIWPSIKPMDSLFSFFLRRRSSYSLLVFMYSKLPDDDKPLLRPRLSPSPYGIPRLPDVSWQAYVLELPPDSPPLVQSAVTAPQSGLIEMTWDWEE